LKNRNGRELAFAQRKWLEEFMDVLCSREKRGGRRVVMGEKRANLRIGCIHPVFLFVSFSIASFSKPPPSPKWTYIGITQRG